MIHAFSFALKLFLALQPERLLQWSQDNSRGHCVTAKSNSNTSSAAARDWHGRSSWVHWKDTDISTSINITLLFTLKLMYCLIIVFKAADWGPELLDTHHWQTCILLTPSENICFDSRELLFFKGVTGGLCTSHHTLYLVYKKDLTNTIFLLRSK